MTRNVVLGLAVALLAVLVVIPLLVLGGELVVHPVAALGAFGSSAVLWSALNTVVLAIGVTVFAVAIGVPLGFLVGRSDLPGRTVWRAVCTTPYVIPPYISAIAWVTLLKPEHGWVNQVLAARGLPGFDIYSIAGMVWVMGLAFSPFVLLATADALERMDASLEEQARIAGAGPWRTLATVTLPMALPGVATGASFVLAAAAASFGVPYLLGSLASKPIFVLTTRIQQEIDLLGAEGYASAAALAVTLLVVGVGLPALLRAILQGRRRFTTVSGKATRVAPFELGWGRWPALGFVSGYALLAVGAPVATILVTSLMRNFGRGFAASNLTLANYTHVLLERSDTLGALGRSLWLAIAAATVAVALGVVVAWMARRTRTPGRNALSALARLPYAVPGTVLALALLLTYSQEIRLILFEYVTLALALSDTLWILGLAYVVKFLAFPVGNADAGLQAVDPSLEEAARMSGSGFLRTMGQITLPLLRPQLVAAWFLVFMPAFSEVTMSILLKGPNTQVVGTLLFDLHTYADPPAAAVLAVVVLVLVLGGSAAVRVVTGGRVGI